MRPMSPIMKHRLKTIAAALGLSLRLERPRRRTMMQFSRHLKNLGYRPGAIIDVGVADGTFELYRVFPDAAYLLIEPLSEFEPALAWIAARYDAHYELAAAGAADEYRVIRFGESLAEMHGASLQALGTDDVPNGPGMRRVPVRRLDRLVEQHHLKGPFLLKIDTQGTEIDVMRGAEGILPEVDVAIIEASFFNFRQKAQQPLIDDVLRFMDERGFFPYDFFGGFNRPLDGALGQIDIAFVKRDGPFRRDCRFAEPARLATVGHRLVSHLRGRMNV
ncbi:MAG TPA: FkbM family methyltransferase [Alphaproteobacteria bacterium]